MHVHSSEAVGSSQIHLFESVSGLVSSCHRKRCKRLGKRASTSEAVGSSHIHLFESVSGLYHLVIENAAKGSVKEHRLTSILQSFN